MEHAAGRLAVVVSGEEIGDALYKIPFLRALRAAFPQHHITWIANENPTAYSGSLRPTVAFAIDAIWEQAGLGRHVRDYLPFAASRLRFDRIIDTRSAVLRVLALRLSVRTPCFISPAGGFLFSDQVPADRFSRPDHALDRLLRLLPLAGAPAGVGHVTPHASTPPHDTLVLPEGTRVLAATLLPEGPLYLGLVPGAGRKHKCWPLERFIAVAQAAAARNLVPAFLLGPEERDWLAPLQAALPQAVFPEAAVPDRDRHLRGWPLVAALGERLELAITNDSGTQHMLALTNTPMVNLYGPTEGRKFQPRVPHRRRVEAQSFGDSAMTAIPVAAVLTALDEVRAERSAARGGV